MKEVKVDKSSLCHRHRFAEFCGWTDEVYYRSKRYPLLDKLVFTNTSIFTFRKMTEEFPTFDYPSSPSPLSFFPIINKYPFSFSLPHLTLILISLILPLVCSSSAFSTRCDHLLQSNGTWWREFNEMEIERMKELLILWSTMPSTRVALVGGNHTAARFCTR